MEAAAQNRLNAARVLIAAGADVTARKVGAGGAAAHSGCRGACLFTYPATPLLLPPPPGRLHVPPPRSGPWPHRHGRPPPGYAWREPDGALPGECASERRARWQFSATGGLEDLVESAYSAARVRQEPPSPAVDADASAVSNPSLPICRVARRPLIGRSQARTRQSSPCSRQIRAWAPMHSRRPGSDCHRLTICRGQLAGGLMRTGTSMSTPGSRSHRL